MNVREGQDVKIVTTQENQSINNKVFFFLIFFRGHVAPRRKILEVHVLSLLLVIERSTCTFFIASNRGETKVKEE